MKNKKILILIFIIMFFILLFSTNVDASSLELQQLDFDVQINVDGSINIKETWDIQIYDTNTLYKTFDKDISKYTNITNVEVIELTEGKYKKLSNIHKEMYHVTKDCYYGLENSNGKFEIAWGVSLENQLANRKYEISYKAIDAVGKYNDYAELYWQFLGKQFQIPAKKISGRIFLPFNAKNKEDIKVWGHTADLNGEIYVTDLNKIEFEVNDYKGNRFVEVRTLIPSEMILFTGRQYDYDILDTVIKEEKRLSENPVEILKFSICVVFVISIFLLHKLDKYILILNKLEEKIKPTNKLKYYNKLPNEESTPTEVLFITSKGCRTTFLTSFSANILYLSLKKYLALKVEKNKKKSKKDLVKITLLNKDTGYLKQEQKIVLDFLQEIAGDKKEITTKDIEKYLKKNILSVKKIDKKIKEILENRYTEESYNKENFKQSQSYQNKMFIYGLIAFLTICILLQIIIFAVSAQKHIIVLLFSLVLLLLVLNSIISGKIAFKLNIFSQSLIDEQEKWKAFKRYMLDISLFKEEIPSIVLWEKYLVYATLFGISTKVMKQLKVIYPDITHIDPNIYNTSYIHMMHSVNIGSSINSSISAGGGGGFSGGGGRWRRRWSVAGGR